MVRSEQQRAAGGGEGKSEELKDSGTVIQSCVELSTASPSVGLQLSKTLCAHKRARLRCFAIPFEGGAQHIETHCDERSEVTSRGQLYEYSVCFFCCRFAQAVLHSSLPLTSVMKIAMSEATVESDGGGGEEGEGGGEDGDGEAKSLRVSIAAMIKTKSEASAGRGEERSDEQEVVSYSTVCCVRGAKRRAEGCERRRGSL